MLQNEIVRCDPEYPDHYCLNCKRFIKQAGQPPKDKVAVVSIEASGSEACMYMPIGFQERPYTASPGRRVR